MNPFHEVCSIFPQMSPEQFDELTEDIREHGQREPIWLHRDGLVIDGRHRWLACRKLGVKPKTETFAGPDPELVGFVVSLNLKRRHLDESQKGMVVARIATLPAHRPSGSAQNCAVTQTAAAEAMGVSRRTAQSAKEVLKNGEPEVIAAVDAGKLPVSAATKITDAPREFQTSVAAKVMAGVKPTEAIRQTKAEQLKARPLAEPNGKHRVIYADPPWQYSDSRAGLAGYSATAAEDHYPTMSVDELSALPVRDLAEDDAVLFCWATFPLLDDAMAVVKAWGFTYKTAFVWSKGRANFGHYHRADAELLLVCVRGSCQPETDKRRSQVVVVDRTGRHSEKPEEFRALVDEMYPTGERIELFRRGAAPGAWRVWGNEAA